MYVGVALGLMILVVAVIMITRNHMQKSRAAAKASAGSEKAMTDEDLRDKIMREMLEEAREKDKKPVPQKKPDKAVKRSAPKKESGKGKK